MGVVKFVDLDPGDPRHMWDHHATAAELRERPGVWAELELPPYYSSRINHGRVRAFQPAGDYQARVVNGRLYARYVGSGGPYESQDRSPGAYIPYGTDGRTKYDHEAIRAEALAAEGEWVATKLPQAYTTGIRRGRWGYTEGEWTSTYRRAEGVVYIAAVMDAFTLTGDELEDDEPVDITGMDFGYGPGVLPDFSEGSGAGTGSGTGSSSAGDDFDALRGR